MSDKLVKLSILKTNKFQDAQYVEDENGSLILDPKGFWTIKNPSDSMKKWILENIPGSTVYTCSSGQYILSPKASNVIKREGEGCGCAIRLRFSDSNGRKWCLMMADNKPYAQHVQGSMNESESEEECIIREAKEETGIDLSNKSLVRWAKYSFLGGNELVDCFWPVTTTVFFAMLEWKEVSHLFPNGLIDNKINIVDAKEYKFQLDETRYILAIPEHSETVFPSKIEEIRVTKQVNGKTVDFPLEFGGHHRALFDCFDSSIPTPKFPFLHSFEIFKRAEEILRSN